MTATRTQTSFLLAQHADSLRDKSKKEFLVGSWTSFDPDAESLEDQGIQLQNQAESREMLIKELAKKAGISNYCYREWLYSHQNKGDMLSPLTVVSVAQPWQRHKLLDFTRNRQNAIYLQEKHYVKDISEEDWAKPLASMTKNKRRKRSECSRRSRYGTAQQGSPSRCR